MRTVFARYEVGGDYRAIDMILVIVVLILVGGRRLEHLNYICDDPLVKRFCGLLRLPRERSVARWLKRFTHKSVMALVEINSQIVGEAIELAARRSRSRRRRRRGRRLRSRTRRSPAAGGAHALGAVHVVTAALLRVAQGFVGEADLLEARLRLGVAVVGVGVVLRGPGAGRPS